MTCSQMLLVCLLLYSCYANCEGKETVQFLMSDAKQPNFNLEAFRTEPNEEEDSMTSESIILPTLNLESHPFAVIVLPNIGKEASLENRQVKSLNRDKDNATLNQLEKTIDEIKEMSEGLSIYSLRKNKGETINLTVAEKVWEPHNEPESSRVLVVDKTGFENTTDVNHNAINVEETNSIQNKNVYSSPPIILKKAPLQESEQSVLRKYLPQDLSFSSKIPLNSEETSREAIATGISQVHQHNVNKNEIENSFFQIQTLPIVDQFTVFQNFSRLERPNQNSDSTNKFSKNQAVEINGSFNDQYSVGIESEQEELSQEEDRWAEIFVVPVGLVKNVQEGNQKLQTESNLNVDQRPFSQSTNEFLSVEQHSTKQEKIDLDSQSSIPINPLLVKFVDLTNSSALGSDLHKRDFKLMNGVGLPPSYFKTPASNDRIADTADFFDATRPMPVEIEQITKLTNQKNQPISFKTTTLLPKTLEKENLTYLDPQKVIESLKFYDVEHKNLQEFEKLGKGFNNSIVFLDLLSTEKTNPNSEGTNTTHNQPSDPNSNSIHLTNSDESGDILNWSNFVTTKNKTDEDNVKRSTTSEEKSHPNFSILESVITPIRSQFIENIALNENPSKIFDVVMERFNISDAIRHHDQTRPINLHKSPTSNFHFYPANENVPFSFPDINVPELISNSYEQHFQISPNVKTYRENPVSIPELPPSNFIPSNEIQESVPEISPADINLSGSIEEEGKSPFEIGCHGNEVGCRDVTDTSTRSDSVRQSGDVTKVPNEGNDFEIFDDIIDSKPQPPIVTDTASVTRTNPDPEAIVIIKGSGISSVSESPLFSSVRRELAGSATPILTSSRLQNITPRDTATKLATVTVNTHSAAFSTKTETTQQTKFVTITKTVVSQNLRTSKLLHHATAIKPSTVTVTRTVDAITTITQTLYSTVCDTINEDYPDDEYFTQLNNYGLNAKHLVKNPFYAQLRDHNRRRKHLQRSVPRVPYFDELYWPKEPKSTEDSASHLFLEDQYTPDIDTFAQSYYMEPDSMPQGTSDTMSVTLPDPEMGGRRARQVNLFPHSQLYYGIPFYGSEILNRKFMKVDLNI